MSFIKWTVAIALVVFVAGCGTTAIIDRNAPGPAADESIIVFGLKPERTRVMFFPGTKTGNQFLQNEWLGAVINGIPQDGYVVAKVKAGQVLGLTHVIMNGDGITGQPYNACGGTRAPTFEVPGGQTLYMADIEYVPEGNRLSVRYNNMFQAAKEYLYANYPNIKGDLRPLVWEPLTTAAPCKATPVVIPIYIGR